VLCSGIEHKLEREAPWGLPDGSDAFRHLTVIMSHTDAHRIIYNILQAVKKCIESVCCVVQGVGVRWTANKLGVCQMAQMTAK